MKKIDPTEIIPPPDYPIRRRLYYIATNFWFDTTVNVLIIVNMIPISLELSVDEDVSYFIVLRVLNYIFCSIYVSEAIIKVTILHDIVKPDFHMSAMVGNGSFAPLFVIIEGENDFRWTKDFTHQ